MLLLYSERYQHPTSFFTSHEALLGRKGFLRIQNQLQFYKSQSGAVSIHRFLIQCKWLSMLPLEAPLYSVWQNVFWEFGKATGWSGSTGTHVRNTETVKTKESIEFSNLCQKETKKTALSISQPAKVWKRAQTAEGEDLSAHLRETILSPSGGKKCFDAV